MAAWAFLRPRLLPRAVAVLPIVALCLFLGTFERVREFVRKPFVIGGYMYANGLRVEDYPLSAAGRPAAPRRLRRRAGHHARQPGLAGRGGLPAGLQPLPHRGRPELGGDQVPQPGRPRPPLDEAFIRTYIPGMHKAWYFMPPFPGSDAERDALAAYIVHDPPDARPAAQRPGRRAAAGTRAWTPTPADGGVQP